MRAIRTAALAIAAVLGAASTAFAQQPADPTAVEPPAAVAAPPTAPETYANVEANYAIGLGDVIEVSIVGRNEYNNRARVAADGTIVLPLIGQVQAANLRPTDLAETVRGLLEKGSFYSKPVVRVEIVTVGSRFVTVLGTVGSPGLIALDRSYHLSEILARVGARIGGGGGDYVILTHSDGKQSRLQMTDIATGALNTDPLIIPGDKIYVPAPENEVFYINGAVRSPGVFPLLAGMTVRTALARAGGVAETGNAKKFDIYRKGAKLPKATLETPIEVGDIVTFGERMF